MNRNDKIKLMFTRNWNLPGGERLARLLKPSASLKASLKDSITWLNGEALGIFTSADNYIESSILSTGTYEAEIGKLIAISLREGNTALDIGANIGLQSMRMSKCCGRNGRVLAFEPLHYLQEKFLKNVELNGLENISLYPFALSDRETETDYLIDENSWNQGTFSLGNLNTGKTLQKIRIKIGDLLPEIMVLDNLRLIKIDVEGFEFPVIRGLQNSIQKFKPRIIFEYDENYWLKNNLRISECFDLLTQWNYNLYQISAAGCILIRNADSIEGGNIFCLPS